MGCPGLPRGIGLADASGPRFIKWEPPSSAGEAGLLIGLWLVRSHFSNEAPEGRRSELRNAAWDCSTPGCQVLAEGAGGAPIACNM